MTPTERARAIIDAVIAQHGNEVWLGAGYNADDTLCAAIAAAIAAPVVPDLDAPPDRCCEKCRAVYGLILSALQQVAGR